MVIRRFREHVADQNWFAVLIDVGIVVLGVFLGTQVSNWNADRLETRRAEELRLRLIEELDFNARQYALQNAYYRQAKAYGLQALADLNGTKPLPDQEFVIAAYQVTQTDTTKPKTGVFDEMTASWLTTRLGGPETQNMASDFYLTVDVTERVIEAIFPYRTLLREVMPYDVQIAIRTTCGDRNVFYQGRLVGIRLVVPCPLRLDPATTATAAGIVRSTPNIRREMTRYIASLDEKLDNLELAHRQAEGFRKRLIAEADGPAA
jgi:hypothetical protein